MTDDVHFVAAVFRALHTVAVIKKAVQVLQWNAGIRRASQSDDLPQHDPERPPDTWTRCSHFTRGYRYQEIILIIRHLKRYGEKN